MNLTPSTKPLTLTPHLLAHLIHTKDRGRVSVVCFSLGVGKVQHHVGQAEELL